MVIRSLYLAVLMTWSAQAGFVHEGRPFTFGTNSESDFTPMSGNVLLGCEGLAVQNSAEGAEGTSRNIGALTDGLVPNSKPAAYSVQNGTILQWSFPDGYQSLSELRAYSLFDWAGHNDISFGTVEVLDGYGVWTPVSGLTACYSANPDLNTVEGGGEALRYRRLFVTTDDGEPFAVNARGLRITFGPSNSFSSFAEIEASGATTWLPYGEALISGPVAYTAGDTATYTFSAPGCILQPQIPMEVTRTVAGGNTDELGIVLPATNLAVPYLEGASITYTCKPATGVTPPAPVLSAVSSEPNVASDSATLTLHYSILWAGSDTQTCSLSVAYGTDPDALTTTLIASNLATGDTGSFTLSGLTENTTYSLQLVAQNNAQLIGTSPIITTTTAALPRFSWTHRSGSNWDNGTLWDTGSWPDGIGHIAQLCVDIFPGTSFDFTLRTPITLGTLRYGSLLGGGWLRINSDSSNNGSLTFDKAGAPALLEAVSGGVYTYAYCLSVPTYFGDELLAYFNRFSTFEIRKPVTGGLFHATPDHQGTFKFYDLPSFSTGLTIDSGTIATSFNDPTASDFFGPNLQLSMGSPNAIQAARLEYGAVSKGQSQSIGNLSLNGPSESILSMDGNASNPTTISVDSLSRTGDAALTLELRDVNKLADCEHFTLPTTLPTDPDGMLPSWLILNSYYQYHSRFLDLAPDGTVTIHPETTTFDATTPTQVVHVNRHILLSEPQIVRSLRIEPNQQLSLNGQLLTLDHNGTPGLLFGNESVIDGTPEGSALSWNGNLFVHAPSYPTRRTDQIHSATLRNALPNDASGTLSKTGFGRLTIEQDTLPQNIEYRILNGILQSKSSTNTLFDRNAYSITGPGTLEFAGNRTISFLGSDLDFSCLAFHQGATGIVGQGQTLRTRKGLQLLTDSTLILTNGAQYVNGSVPLYVGEDANDATLIATGRDPQTGTPTTLNLNGASLVCSYSSQGYSSNRTRLLLSDGAVATNVLMLSIGENQGGRDNNTLTLESGAKVYARFARFGSMCCDAIATITGEDTLLDLAGGGLDVGESGGGVGPCNNRLLISEGAHIRNVGTITLARSSNGNTTNNYLVLSSGARIDSSGDLNIAYPNTANGWISNHWVVVEGEDTLWNATGGGIYIGRAEQGYVRGCSMTLRDGARVQGFNEVQVGRGHARSTFDNTLTITNHASLSSSGQVNIAIPSSNDVKELAGNRAILADGGLWNLNGGSLTIGNRNNCVAWAYDNWLVLEPGGSVTNAGATTLGSPWNASRVITTTNELGVVEIVDQNSCANGIRLHGGSFSGNSLLIHPGNRIEANIEVDDFGAAFFSGTAEFKENTILSVSACSATPDGIYLVLQADGGFVGLENLSLETATPDYVSLRLTDTAIYAHVHKPATIIRLR